MYCLHHPWKWQSPSILHGVTTQDTNPNPHWHVNFNSYTVHLNDLLNMNRKPQTTDRQVTMVHSVTIKLNYSDGTTTSHLPKVKPNWLTFLRFLPGTSKWFICNIKYIYIYTGCPRRKGPNFGRVFLRSNYTDITQNTYIRSSMVMEILAREKCGCLLCLRTVLCPWRHTSHMHLPSTR